MDLIHFPPFLCLDNTSVHHINDNNADDISDEDKIALNGKPKLGAISKIEVIIKESDEFKVSCYHDHIVIHISQHTCKINN